MMLSKAVRHLSRSVGARVVGARQFSALDSYPYEAFGKTVFSGEVADKYLQKHGANGELLDDPTWVNHSSDTVAAAVFDWYVSFRLLFAAMSLT